MNKLRFLLFTLVFISYSGIAQFSTISKKGKTGLKFNSEIVFKPKADSINIASDSIATVYKKSKIFYINSAGERIYKAKLGLGQPFHNEFAVLQHKKGKYGAINSDGKLVVPFDSRKPGVYFGNMLLVDEYSQHGLFTPNGRVMNHVDSVVWVRDWVEVHQTKTESYQYVKKRLFRRDEVKTGYRDVHHKRVYDPISYERLTEDGFYRDFEDYIYFYDYKNHSYLISTDRSVRIEGISDVKEKNQQYLEYKSNKQKTLFSREKGVSIVSGDYLNYRINSHTIYAIKDSSYGIFEVDIYDFEGNLKQSDLAYVRDLDSKRKIFMLDSTQFIGNEFGDQLSDTYAAFGEAQNGYRIVYFGASYGYINDSTYRLLPIEYPLIAKHHSGGGGRRRRGGFFRAIGQMVGDIFRAVTLQRPKHRSYGGSTGSYDYTKLSESGNHFYDGWAKVCLHGVNEEKKYDSLLIVESYQKIPYNFIDTNGTLMNSRKYIKAGEFRNGRTYVKERDYFYVIDNKGKKVNNHRFRYLELIENGYYKATTSRGREYILSNDYREVANCDCWRIIQDEDGIYDIHWGDTTAVYIYPKD